MLFPTQHHSRSHSKAAVQYNSAGWACRLTAAWLHWATIKQPPGNRTQRCAQQQCSHMPMASAAAACMPYSSCATQIRHARLLLHQKGLAHTDTVRLLLLSMAPTPLAQQPPPLLHMPPLSQPHTLCLPSTLLPTSQLLLRTPSHPSLP
jgi:hypothetical protein